MTADLSALPASYEDEMDERYAVRSADEQERQHHRKVHAERMALLHGSVSHTPLSAAILRAKQGEGE